MPPSAGLGVQVQCTTRPANMPMRARLRTWPSARPAPTLSQYRVVLEDGTSSPLECWWLVIPDHACIQRRLIFC